MAELKNLPSVPDEALMTLYSREGSEPAFAELYRRHAPRLWGYLARKVANPSDREAVFQDVFVKLHASKELYQEAKPFAPWFFVVTRNVLFDFYRKTGRRRECLLPEQVNGVEPEAEQIEMPNLDGLTSDERTAIEMRYGDEASFADIAKILGKSDVGARQLVSRAVRQLRTMLKGGKK